MATFLIRHKNALLTALLIITMVVSCLCYMNGREADSISVSIPVVNTAPLSSTPLEQFRRQRDDTTAADMAVLRDLCAQDALDDRTREDAALQLQRMIDRREKQLALEGALSQSGIAPCAAVVSEGCVTIVTEKDSLSSSENTLILTLCSAHAGVEPSGVRVITASESQ